MTAAEWSAVEDIFAAGSSLGKGNANSAECGGEGGGTETEKAVAPC